MRKARMIIMPIAILGILLVLCHFEVQLDAIAAFNFIWDIMLGIALGIGIALVPSVYGYKSSQNNQPAYFWVSGFVTMVLIFCQYMSTVISINASITPFLPATNIQMRIVEGAFLGYCSFIAARDRI